MMSNDQIRLDLDDRKQYFTQKINEGKEIASDTDYYIFHRSFIVANKTCHFLYFGTRTHNLGGTDYNYLERVSLDEAKWLLETEFDRQAFHNFRSCTRVFEFMDAIKTYEAANDQNR